MLKSDISRAVDTVENEGSAKDADRLVIAVRAHPKAAPDYKEDLKEALLEEYGASEVKRLSRGGDMVVGFLVRASDLARRRFYTGDLAGLLVDGKGDVVGYYHSGRSFNIDPGAFTFRGAACIDDNSEAHQDIMRCARALVYGSGRGRGEPYYVERTSRQNPSRRRR